MYQETPINIIGTSIMSFVIYSLTITYKQYSRVFDQGFWMAKYTTEDTKFLNFYVVFYIII